jgi:hypothetical protein
MKSTVSAGVFFTQMENFSSFAKKYRPTEEHYTQNKIIDFLIACGSKTTASFSCNPINVVKTRIEGLTGESQLKNIDVMKDVYQKGGGLRGFYRGFGATLVRDVPYSGLQFLFYKILYDLEPIIFPSI